MSVFMAVFRVNGVKANPFMQKPQKLKPASNFLRAANLCFVVLWFVNSVFSVSAAPPEIVHGPRGQTVILYQQAAFGVIATGTAPLSYQWRKDGAAIAGATNDQMVIAQSQFSDAVRYSVLVSNAEGTATSAEASLTVNPPQAGDMDFSFVWSSAMNGDVRSFVVQPDGKVIIGGAFTAVTGVARHGLARLKADGILDSGFEVELSGDYPIVNTMALQPDGKVLVGGYFTGVNGVPVSGIARLYSDGTLDTDFRPEASDIPYVFSIAVQGYGKMLIARSGGAFGGIATSVERLNPDGGPDTGFHNWNTGWNPNPFNTAFVNSLVLQNDGKVLVSGGNIVPFRLNADGTLDSGFTNEAGLGSSFSSVVGVQQDGKIVVGVGSLNDCGPRTYPVCRLHGDGTLDAGFHAEVSGRCGSQVSAIAMQRDGKVLIGGVFNAVNGESRSGIARLNMDGTLDRSFRNGMPGVVGSIAVQGDGNVLIAVQFRMANDELVAGIARLWGSADIPPHIASLNRSGAGVELRWDALPNRTYRVQYKDDLAAPWTDLAGTVFGSLTGTASKTDATIGNASRRFYRVDLSP